MTKLNTESNKKVTIQYLAIPESDWDWIGSQPGFVVTLWRESWSCDRYGNRWVEITPSLSNNRFLTAKKILESAKLFEFKSEKLTSDGRKVSKWLVRNLHGCRVDSFWRNPFGEESNPFGEESNPFGEESNPFGEESNPNGLAISPETLTQKAFQNPSLSTSINNPINKEKEINNINTLHVEDIYKNNISTLPAREESELDPRCDEPSLEATAHRDCLQEKESLSASQAEIVETLEVELSVPEMAAIVKSEYPNLLPSVPEGFKRKAFKLLENGLEKLFVFDLLETEIESVLAILDEYAESGDSNPVVRFIEEFAFAVVAKFRFEGLKVREYSLCG
jgi:hypothetical protein